MEFCSICWKFGKRSLFFNWFVTQKLFQILAVPINVLGYESSSIGLKNQLKRFYQSSHLGISYNNLLLISLYNNTFVIYSPKKISICFVSGKSTPLFSGKTIVFMN
ncbi:predicted protein [Methanosarcina acetivorans C2A]|uniref:Uncharacterized protein n=1 Tax=Methanosarcina acetivorans (strain ATCC 35395 / DSM 2834 / JCM 12185 / C2A) TaxID=188937 RepID=Q8THS1_METAC|nr:predicted protein [Methanosarcina acetivorans C2A]